MLHFFRHDHPLHDFYLLAAGQTHDHAPGDAIQKAIRRGRVQLTIHHEEDIGAGAFGDLTTPIHHQRIIETLRLGFVLGERADHVKPRRLAGGRRGFRMRALPTGDVEADPLHAIIAEQIGPCPGGDHEMDFGLLRRDRKLLGTTPRKRTDIGIHQPVGGHNIAAGLIDLISGVGNLKA